MSLEKLFANIRKALAGSKPGLEGMGERIAQEEKKKPGTHYN